ncbi:DUF4124 domain-containing protein [Stenotrophomonas sp. YIM B06876]|uniref:DUF4124 domain-containing protein n=1 Tax=Stenotrophomonas sp. YIM B06876 TaxID=3060211 RepID=UPI0027383E61|nr:DUF4124 domain-containing protein [Stenotrophomonas sp. YIM B06876]
MDVRLIIALMALAATANAQQVHKCVEGGNAIYQSAPCSSGAPVKSWDAHAAADRSVDEVHRLERIRRDLAVRNPPHDRRRNYRVPGRTTRTVAPTQCEATRAQRAAAYEKAGMKRSFQLSSYWDNRVQQACK